MQILNCHTQNDDVKFSGNDSSVYGLISTGIDNTMSIPIELTANPNPAKDYIIIELHQNTTEAKIKVYDIYRKTIKEIISTTNVVQWDCANTRSGVYFYHTEIGGLIYRGKVVIK